MKVVCRLPNACTLYREPNGVGGHRYWSDEVGGGVMLWDTCLVAPETLMAAMVEEARRERLVKLAAEYEDRTKEEEERRATMLHFGAGGSR